MAKVITVEELVTRLMKFKNTDEVVVEEMSLWAPEMGYVDLITDGKLKEETK